MQHDDKSDHGKTLVVERGTATITKASLEGIHDVVHRSGAQEPEPAVEEMNDGSNAWPFGGDRVIQGTRHYPEEERSLVRWFYDTCRSEGIGLRAAAGELRLSTTTVWRFCQGKYEGSLKNVCKEILRFRELHEARRALQGEVFVETSVTRDIARICRRALEYNKMALVTGPTQIGKTTAQEAVVRAINHGTTKLVRLPSSAGVQLVAKEFASACRLSRDCPFEMLRERIHKSIDRNHLVLVDEMEQIFESYQKTSRMRVVNFIREIHDITKCGMVLFGAPSFEEEIETGNLKEMLRKLGHRCVFRLELPPPEKLPRQDLVKISEAYKLPAPGPAEEELVREILRVSGLGMFVAYLRAAGELAQNEKARLTWSTFTRAHDIMNKGRKARRA